MTRGQSNIGVLMSVSIFHNVTLKAVNTVVPAQKISIEDELEYYGNNAERAARLTEVSGFRSRRVAAPGVTASDLCIQAAETLLQANNVDKSSIDALIFVSHTPDYQLPASAAIQQHVLGLSQACATMDMNVGCAGFLNAAWVAAGLIESKACRKVLVLTGDTPNRFQDTANRVVAPVFGDAGTAALLEFDEQANPISFLLGSNGEKFDVLGIPGGGSRLPHLPDETQESPINQSITDPQGNPWTLGGYGKIWMDGMAVYSFTMSVIPEHIKRHLQAIQLEASSLDWLLLHQANKIVVQGIAKKIGFTPAKAPFSTLEKYGNLGAMSLPAQICETFSDKHITDRKKIMLCSFGAGLAWASCQLSLEHCHAMPVAEFKEPAGAISRQELIAHWHSKFKGK